MRYFLQLKINSTPDGCNHSSTPSNRVFDDASFSILDEICYPAVSNSSGICSSKVISLCPFSSTPSATSPACRSSSCIVESQS
eukprot:UN14835